MASDDPQDIDTKIKALGIWQGGIRVAPLTGGLTNRNYRVDDASGSYVVRFGHDIHAHGILRFNEAAAAIAAFHAGVSPEVVYSAPGLMVSRFIPGKTLTPEDIRDPARLERIVNLIRTYHRGIGEHHTGPVLAFWVFQVNRSYINTLRKTASILQDHLERLNRYCATLEKQVGPVEMVFSHNDLLAANFIDDGKRLWILDWDYAGMNTPLFDLANLSSNNELDAAQDEQILTWYFGEAPGPQRVRALQAMKCASLLRETLWGAVSEQLSDIDFDYVAYTNEYLARLERAMAAYGFNPPA